MMMQTPPLFAEPSRKYFDIACQRIATAQAQGQLLPPEPVAAPEQQTIEL